MITERRAPTPLGPGGGAAAAGRRRRVRDPAAAARRGTCSEQEGTRRPCRALPRRRPTSKRNTRTQSAIRPNVPAQPSRAWRPTSEFQRARNALRARNPASKRRVWTNVRTSARRIGSARARPGHPLRRRPRRGRAEPDHRRRRARRPRHDDAREDAARSSARATSCGGCCCSSRAARRRCRSTSCCPSAHPEADAGFLIMESSSYEGMSGSNTINTATVLLETGMRADDRAGHRARARGAGRARARARRLPRRPLRAHHVRERPVVRDPPRRAGRGPGHRRAAGRRRLRRRVLRLRRRRGARLRDRARGGARARRPRASASARRVAEQLEIAHPVEPALGVLSFVVFTAAPRDGGDARNATVVAPGRLDRCATGTATSARIAVLAARGLIDDGDAFVNESVIDTRLRRPHRRPHARSATPTAIVPAISGRAWITGIHQFVLDPDDPFPDRLPAPRHLGRRALRLRVLSRADVERGARPRRAGRGAGGRVRRPQRRPRVDAAAHRRRGPRRGHDPADGRARATTAPSVTAKLVSLFPGHDPAHQAAIVVFDAATGTPVALMDGDAITAARTAAGSRLATRLLARADARVLAVVGTGVQGEAHVRALQRERDWARGPDRRAAARGAARSARRAPRRHRRRLGRGGRPRRRRRLRRHRRHRARAAARVARARRARQLRRLHHAGPRARRGDGPRRARRGRVARVRAGAPARRQRRPRGRGGRTRSWASSSRGTRPGRSGPDELTLYKSVGVGSRGRRGGRPRLARRRGARARRRRRALIARAQAQQPPGRPPRS